MPWLLLLEELGPSGRDKHDKLCHSLIPLPMTSLCGLSLTWCAVMCILRPPQPQSYSELWSWATRLLISFELLGSSWLANRVALLLRWLFGRDHLERQLRGRRTYIDVWFTGGDFAAVALGQLASAIERKPLGQCIYFMKYFILFLDYLYIIIIYYICSDVMRCYY